ncbi:hypothetical protein QFC20_003106 [Naganishia adeliensis]|uniref:Uncharacterized protein n=1 Tax=Naganishia adeliensis TaxID=92952 RepID=A0ACC2WEF3_9TREE|nr:hypothetical protein QFC20_003106 [Naganishia adeliensis]
MSKQSILYSADVARVAMKASGADYKIVEIDLKNKPEWYQPKINPASKVPALWYDAPRDADATAPPPGTFILPESALIVDFIASVYPDLQFKDPITRAKGALMALQYEAVSKAWFAYSVMSDGGSGKELDDFLNAVREFTPFIPEEVVKSDDYGVADIMIAPFMTRIFEFSRREAYPWNEKSGETVLSALSADEFKQFRAYHDKLAKWDALQSTVDCDKNTEYMKKHMGEMKARFKK